MLKILNVPIARIFVAFFLAFSLLAITIDINGSYGFIKSQILVILTFVGYTVYLAWYLGQLDGNDKKISHHWLRFLTRGILLSILPLAAFGFTFKAISISLLCFAVFWPLFNQSYNHTKGNHWSYVGTKANFDKAIRYLNELGLAKIYPLWLVLFQTLLIIYFTFLTYKHY